MSKRWKRGISLLVSAAMAVCMMPTVAFAKTTEASVGQGLLGDSNGSSNGDSNGYSETVTSLTLNEEITVRMAAGGKWVGTFTAPRAGSYVFHQNGGTEMDSWIYSDAELKNELAYCDSYCICRLTKGQTVYFVVENYSDLSEVIVFVKSRGESADIPSIKEVYAYTGEPVKLEAEVADGHGVLTEGYDFEFVFYDTENENVISKPTEMGKYYVRARSLDLGDDSWITDKYLIRIVEKDDLSAGSITLGKTWYEVTGSPIEVNPVVRDSEGKILTEGIDYVLVFDGDEYALPPSKLGKYKLEARAIGSKYCGEIALTGNIYIYDSKDIGDIYWYSHDCQSADRAYDPYDPEDVVSPPIMYIFHKGDETHSFVSLVVDQDYQFAYFEDKNGAKLSGPPTEYGIYYAVYEGCGSYTGEYRQKFRLYGDTHDLSEATVVLTDKCFSYTGYTFRIVWCVEDIFDDSIPYDSYNRVYYDQEGNPLDKAPTDPGTYQVSARAAEGSSYWGETPKATFSILGENDLNHSCFDVSRVSRYNYTGNPIDSITINSIYSPSGEALIEGTDYRLDHFEDLEGTSLGTTVTDIGEYYAVIAGKGNYTGEKKLLIDVIDPYDLSYATLNLYETQLDDGTTTALSRIWDSTGKELEIGTDYVLVYLDSKGREYSTLTKAGTYTAYAKPGSNGKYKRKAYTASYFDYNPNIIIDLSKANVNVNVNLGAATYTYDGKAKNPGVKSVVVDGQTLVEGTDYTVNVPAGRTDVGTYTYTITGKGNYSGKVTASFKIVQAASKITLKAQSKKYTGNALKYSGQVTRSGSTGKVTYTYYSDAKGQKEVKATNVKNAGTYYVRATLAADKNHKKATSALVKFKITKVANTMTVKTSKSKTVSAAKLKKNAVTVKCITVSKAAGTFLYKLSGVKKASFKKYFKVNTKTGKITVKKGLKKGTYTLTVTVTAAGDKNHNKGTKKVSFKIVVK